MGFPVSRFLLAEGKVGHSRTGKSAHRFQYPIFYLQFPVNEEEPFKRLLRKKFGSYLTLRSEDYLRAEAGALEHSVRSLLKSECGFEAESIELLTLPRMLGYGFNPINLWWCRRGGILEAVLAEVNNTFGERHFYWIHNSEGIHPEQWIRAEKVFHVSPFFPVDGYYEFRFDQSAAQFRVQINYRGPDAQLRLATWLEGKYQPIDIYSRKRLFFRYGWMSLAVMARIH